MSSSGILEVLVVSARGIKHSKLMGKRAYYVILECGAQMHKTKVSPFAGTHDKKAYWNEKFTFQYPLIDWTKLTHLQLKIMDKKLFKNGGFVGQTKIHLGGIITEGSDKGFIELTPTRYNVVLHDDSYKGEIKIGFKFIANRESESNSRREWTSSEEAAINNDSIFRSILNLCKNTLRRLFFPHKKPCSSPSSKTKTN